MPNLLDLIECDLVVRAIVELGGTWTLVSGHGLSVSKRAAIIQVCGDTGGAESMVTNCGRNAGGPHASLQYAPGIRLGHPAISQGADAAVGRAKKRALAIEGQAGAADVILEITLEMMVAGHVVLLAAFSVQAYPAAPALYEVVPHLYLEHRADTRKAIYHHGDEGAVAQPEQCGLLRFQLGDRAPVFSTSGTLSSSSRASFIDR